ncbi:MAG: GNAT family N-acetyltransferase [Ktedonobacteraceae bacterium]
MNSSRLLTYERQGNRIIFLHTGVPVALAGHGIASKLASFALEEARSQKLTVIPVCPFVADYIQHHQEYLLLLTPSEQTRLLQG